MVKIAHHFSSLFVPQAIAAEWRITMFKFFSNKKVEIFAPVDGEIIHLKNVNDAAFSQELMGPGFAIEPKANRVVSPVTGIIDSIFPTKHAIVIKNKQGINVLIHMGIDTVELNGAGFDVSVTVGQAISEGELLATIDLSYLESQGKRNTIICVFPELEGQVSIKYQDVLCGEKIGNVELK